MTFSRTMPQMTILGLAALMPRPADAQPAPIDSPKIVVFQRGSTEGGDARAEMQALEAQVAAKLAEIKALEAKVKAAQERLNKPETPRVVAQPRRDGVVTWEFVPSNDKATLPAQAKGTLYELVPGEKGTLVLRPVTQPAPAQGLPGEPPLRIRIQPAIPGTPMALLATPMPMVSGFQPQPRTKDLEKRLDDIIRELEELRRELKAPKPSRPPEQGKLEFGQPMVIQLDLGDLKVRTAPKTIELSPSDLLAPKGTIHLELHKELDRETQEALADVEKARAALEKARAVLRPDAPQLAEYEKRMADAMARLAKQHQSRPEQPDKGKAAKELQKALELLKTPQNPEPNK